MGSEQIQSKVVILEVSPSDYLYVERAARQLGYAVPEFLLLSTSLVASAVVNGDDVLRTPPELRGNTSL